MSKTTRRAEPLHRILARLGLQFRRPGAAPGGRWLPYRSRTPELPPTLTLTQRDAYPKASVVPLHCITASPGFSFAERGWHPYVATLQEYVADPKLRYDDSTLCRTFSTFVPTNAQEALLEDVDRVLFPLHRLPPRVAGHEWWLPRAEVVRAIRGSPPRWMHQGKRVFGPVDHSEARSEFDQLIRVYQSVREHGLLPELSSDPIRGYFLVRDDDYRFVLTGGQHRVAALRLLGEKEITVRIDWLRAVREDELYRWTEECGGPYPADIAHLIFDKLFDEDGLSKARNLGITA